MEPRSFERGKRPETDRCNSCIDELQWSRVRLNAERSPHPQHVSNAAQLQWSRVRLNAERGQDILRGTVSQRFNGAAFV